MNFQDDREETDGILGTPFTFSDSSKSPLPAATIVGLNPAASCGGYNMARALPDSTRIGVASKLRLRSYVAARTAFARVQVC